LKFDPLNTGVNVQAYLRAIPKVELHLHLEGSLDSNLLFKLAERNGIKLPVRSEPHFSSLRKFDNFKQFSNILLMGVSCLRTPQDFFDAVFSLGQYLENQNIRYVEVHWTPQFYLNRGYHLNDFLDAMNSARQHLEKKTGIKMRWIPGLVRSYPQPSSFVASWAASNYAKDGGVVALGLGGPEESYPAIDFEMIFKGCDLPANPHAGECAGPQSVWQTLNYLSPKRIGHGVRSVEDEILVAYLARNEISLEICITSNICLGVYDSYSKHPVKKLIDAGCLVSLNTDDPILFNTNLSHEYTVAFDHCLLTLSDIRKSIFNAINSSYLNKSEKDELRNEFIINFIKLDKLFNLT
jgi:adenosine deaminase